jgi:ABC-type oligopeptide transport system substrate-binding subunit
MTPLQPAYSDDEIARELTTGPLAHALLTPDPATLIIQLSRPDGALLSKLAAPFSGVAERALALRYSNDWPSYLADPDVRGASGMYAVTDWRAATRAAAMTLTLTRSATYWGARPRLRQIVVTFGSDMTGLATVAYRNGSQDMALDASQDPDVGAARLPGYHTASRRSLALLYFNPTIASLDDLRLREALALALNRRARQRGARWDDTSGDTRPTGYAGIYCERHWPRRGRATDWRRERGAGAVARVCP